MKECIYNLYIYVNNDIISELGVAIREAYGSDESKIRLLQSTHMTDLAGARRFPVPSRYSIVFADGVKQPGMLAHDTFNYLASMNQHLAVFEDLFSAIGAPRAPLTIITPIVNGAIPKTLTVAITPLAR